eukprot:scaffold16155_cov21-Tisochrysis_lutea.AAC.1
MPPKPPPGGGGPEDGPSCPAATACKRCTAPVSRMACALRGHVHRKECTVPDSSMALKEGPLCMEGDPQQASQLLFNLARLVYTLEERP